MCAFRKRQQRREWEPRPAPVSDTPEWRRLQRDLQRRFRVLGTRWGGSSDENPDICRYCGKDRTGIGWIGSGDATQPRMCLPCFIDGRRWEDTLAFISCRYCGESKGPSVIRKHEETCPKRIEKASQVAVPTETDAEAVARLFAENGRLRARTRELESTVEDLRKHQLSEREPCFVCALPAEERIALFDQIIAALGEEQRRKLVHTLVVPMLVKRLQEG